MAKKIEPQRKVGRPTKYDPKYCDELIEHMKTGLSYEAFAGRLCVAIQTLYDWEQANPEFLEAKKKGQAISQMFWENLAMEGMWSGGGRNPVFNSTVWIFNMKNRFKWKDRVETTVETTKPITIAYDPAKEVNKDESN